MGKKKYKPRLIMARVRYFMKNPQTTIAPTFLTHIISAIVGVSWSMSKRQIMLVFIMKCKKLRSWLSFIKVIKYQGHVTQAIGLYIIHVGTYVIISYAKKR